MHPSLVAAAFRAEFGRTPEQVFASFEAEPFAAASLGQVHRAVTIQGEPVAVKVQYPAIREAIRADVRWFRTVSKPAQLSKHLPPAVIDEIEQQFLAETDYRQEAANLEFFRRALRPLGFVQTPRVVKALCGDRVLTMSIVNGMHIDDFLRTRPSQQVRDMVGERLLELYYFQVMRLERFHADPHWGNYLFRSDGSIGLVDFGCVKRLSKPFAASLRRMYLYPGDFHSAEVERLLVERYAGFSTKLSPRTMRALIRFAENFYRKVYPPQPELDDRPFDFSDAGFLRQYLREASNLANERGAAAEYVFLSRAETGVYHTLHRLRARVHTSRIVRKYLR
jgi:predicted unusual protein kinase regulating ubiquinone biosynthesis (AarF/ABC1/UbiB family)